MMGIRARVQRTANTRRSRPEEYNARITMCGDDVCRSWWQWFGWWRSHHPSHQLSRKRTQTHTQTHTRLFIVYGSAYNTKSRQSDINVHTLEILFSIFFFFLHTLSLLQVFLDYEHAYAYMFNFVSVLLVCWAFGGAALLLRVLCTMY